MKYKVNVDWMVRNNVEIVVESDTVEHAEAQAIDKARIMYETLPWDIMDDEFYVRDGETKEVKDE